MEVSQFDYLSLFARQGCQRALDLPGPEVGVSLLRNIHLWIRDPLQDEITILRLGDGLRTDIAPAVRIDGEVARDPVKPARKRSTLGLICGRALPGMPDASLPIRSTRPPRPSP